MGSLPPPATSGVQSAAMLLFLGYLAATLVHTDLPLLEYNRIYIKVKGTDSRDKKLTILTPQTRIMQFCCKSLEESLDRERKMGHRNKPEITTTEQYHEHFLSDVR